jgi:hypothetical protein
MRDATLALWGGNRQRNEKMETDNRKPEVRTAATLVSAAGILEPEFGNGSTKVATRTNIIFRR